MYCSLRSCSFEVDFCNLGLIFPSSLCSFSPQFPPLKVACVCSIILTQRVETVLRRKERGWEKTSCYRWVGSLHTHRFFRCTIPLVRTLHGGAPCCLFRTVADRSFGFDLVSKLLCIWGRNSFVCELLVGVVRVSLD